MVPKQRRIVGVNIVFKFRLFGSQHLVHKSQHQRAQAGNHPANHNSARPSVHCHVLRQAKNAIADDGAKHQSNQQADAYFLGDKD